MNEEDKMKDNTKWNGWGYSDSRFVVKNGTMYFDGNRYPISRNGKEPFVGFMSWAKNILNIDFSKEDLPYDPSFPTDYPKSIISAEFIQELDKMNIRYSVAGEERLRRSHGQTVYEIYLLRTKQLPKRISDIVLWPEDHNAVEKIVKLAEKYDTVIIPVGGATNVSGAVLCPEHEKRPIASLDTLSMNRMIWINKENLTACFQSGIVGKNLEKILNENGYTSGHEPDSYEFSSLGGWVATRASGMKKNIYGNIEDIVVGFRMVTPRGTLQKKSDIPRMSCGPDFTQLVLGSEGTLGIVTEVTIKIRPAPKIRQYDSFVFKNFECGVKCMREIARQKCQPASVRFMDNAQFIVGLSMKNKHGIFTPFVDFLKDQYLFILKGFNANQICAMTLLFEGDSDDAIRNHFQKIKRIASWYEGICGGATNGGLGYQLTFIVAYLRDIAMAYKVIAESFETSVPWDKTLELCENVKNLVHVKCKELNVVHYVVSCRVTQTYDTGCCVYFYIAFNWTGQTDPAATLHQLEMGAREEILRSGGSLSHHHGVGKLRSQFYPTVASEVGVQLYRATKQCLDPRNVFGVDNLLCRM